MGKTKYNINELIGTSIGLRTIVGVGERTKSNNKTALVRCVCGKESSVEIGHFLAGRYSSCTDCLNKNQIGSFNRAWKGGKHISFTLFSRWRKSAETRKIKWDVTIEYLDSLIENQGFKCVFTGEELTIGHGGKNGLIVNGSASLDRINSSVGYVEGNVQFVAKDVNMAKQKLTDEEFTSLCLRVSNYANGR